MALYQTEAVVIGARNWGEADKMMTFFTRERGLVEAVAFGCRRPRSPLAAGMQLFSYLELQLAEGRRLDTVKQIQLKCHYKKLSEDLSVMAYGALVAEVLREFMPAGVPEPKLFATLLEILTAFESLEFTGLQLRYEHCIHCGKPIVDSGGLSLKEGGALCKNCGEEGLIPFSEDLRRTVLALRDFDWEETDALKLQGRFIMQAERITLNHLRNLLGHNLKAMEFINQI